MKFDHINIRAPRDVLETVKQFYIDVFDLKVGFRPDFSRFGYWLYEDEQAILHLIEGGEYLQNQPVTYLNHVAFRRTGLHDFINRLNQLNIQHSIETIQIMNLTQIFMLDPAGNGVEIGFIGEGMD